MLSNLCSGIVIHIQVFGYKYLAEVRFTRLLFLKRWHLLHVLLVSGLTATVPGTLSMEES